jgi:hypothetical protein
MDFTRVLAERERYRDLLRQAEQHRLVQLARAEHGPRNRFYYRALAWLGHRLIAWGARLQRRYGEPQAIPLLSDAGKHSLAFVHDEGC